MVERWNTGMVGRAINDPIPFLLVQVGQLGHDWACALATMKWPGYEATQAVAGELSTSLHVE